MTEEETTRLERIEGQIAAVIVALRLLILERPQNDSLINDLHDQIDDLQSTLPAAHTKAARDLAREHLPKPSAPSLLA